MEQEVNANATAPFLLIQKPQELIRLFETLIDQKIREVLTTNTSVKNFYLDEDSPFLSSKDVEKIFKVSRQNIHIHDLLLKFISSQVKNCKEEVLK